MSLWDDLRVIIPWLGKRVDKFRTCCREFVVDVPTAREIALAALSGFAKCKQGDNVSDIGVEDLFLSRISRPSDLLGVHDGRQVLDVGKHHVRRLAVVLLVLTAPDRGNMGRDAGVDDDVLLAGVFGDGNTSDYFEPVASVYFAGNVTQRVVQFWQRECFLSDKTERLVQALKLMPRGR